MMGVIFISSLSSSLSSCCSQTVILPSSWPTPQSPYLALPAHPSCSDYKWFEHQCKWLGVREGLKKNIFRKSHRNFLNRNVVDVKNLSEKAGTLKDVKYDIPMCQSHSTRPRPIQLVPTMQKKLLTSSFQAKFLKIRFTKVTCTSSFLMYMQIFFFPLLTSPPCIRMGGMKDNFVFDDILHFSQYTKVRLG